MSKRDKQSNTADYINSMLGATYDKLKTTGNSVSDNISKDLAQDKYYDELKTNTGKKIELIDVYKLVDAPDDINRFKIVNQTKMLEIRLSIIRNKGIFYPLIVWEQSNDNYMILAGHKRTHIVKNILEDKNIFDEDLKNKIKCLPAIVYKKEEIDINKAKEICIDTNYLVDDITPQQRVQLVKLRLEFGEQNIKEFQDNFNKGKSILYEDIILCTRLKEEFQNLYYSGNISRRSALKLASMSMDIQMYILDNYMDKVTNSYIKKLMKSSSKEDIDKLFSDEEVKTVTKVSVNVGTSDVDEFNSLTSSWFNAKSKGSYIKLITIDDVDLNKNDIDELQEIIDNWKLSKLRKQSSDD